MSAPRLGAVLDSWFQLTFVGVGRGHSPVGWGRGDESEAYDEMQRHCALVELALLPLPRLCRDVLEADCRNVYEFGKRMNGDPTSMKALERARRAVKAAIQNSAGALKHDLS